MGLNPAYLFKSLLLYARNIFAHVDLTKNLDFLICLRAAFCFMRAEKFVRK